MNPSTDLVNRLWRLCALLRKDGITYQQYVTELTYLLFLKMASEQKDESRIPEQYRWAALKSASETEVLQRYRQALIVEARSAPRSYPTTAEVGPVDRYLDADRWASPAPACEVYPPCPPQS